MIGVLADILKIVVLAARANALLRIHRTRVAALPATKENILELIHPRIREQQRRIIMRHHRTRWRKGMRRLRHKEVDERLTNLSSSRRSHGTGRVRESAAKHAARGGQSRTRASKDRASKDKAIKDRQAMACLSNA